QQWWQKSCVEKRWQHFLLIEGQMYHPAVRTVSLMRRVAYLLITITFLICAPDGAEAAKKKKKKTKNAKAPIVQVGDFQTVSISIRTGKSKKKKKKGKERTYDIACYNDLGGEVKSKKNQLQFWSFRALKNQAKK